MTLALSLAFAGVGCGSGQQSQTEPTEPPDGSATHVHGFAPGQRSEVLIATHHGLYRIGSEGGAPEPVGQRRHDLMGLTSPGAGRHLASGHPDPRASGMPPNLGLIESRDGGGSWKPVDMYGRADFHVLEARGKRIYAYDGHTGVLRVTSGGRKWREHVTSFEVGSLAIDPRDGERLVASTSVGIAASENEGKSWQAIRPDTAGALSWPEARRLYLLNSAGGVFLSRDAGRKWGMTGTLRGTPEAFEAIGETLYAALLDGSVMRSTDDGATWSRVESF